jgi:hypothetical protein
MFYLVIDVSEIGKRCGDLLKDTSNDRIRISAGDTGGIYLYE